MSFFFGMPLQDPVILGKTLHPGVFYIGIGNTDVEGVIAHLYLGAFHIWRSEGQRRIVNAVNF